LWRRGRRWWGVQGRLDRFNTTEADQTEEQKLGEHISQSGISMRKLLYCSYLNGAVSFERQASHSIFTVLFILFPIYMRGPQVLFLFKSGKYPCCEGSTLLKP
jgi:hypothetical protein